MSVMPLRVMFEVYGLRRVPARDNKQRDRQNAKRQIQPKRVVQREIHHLAVHVGTGFRNPTEGIECDIHDKRRQHLGEKLRARETWTAVAQNFQMDWAMLWKDLALGFLIAGALSVFVPNGIWQTLFVKDASPWLPVPANALLGPIVAVLLFVCSIGNVPMAAVLWDAGVSFGGVLAFLYADLIVLPLLPPRGSLRYTRATAARRPIWFSGSW